MYTCIYIWKLNVCNSNAGCPGVHHSSAAANTHWLSCLLSTEVPPSPPPPDIVEVYEDRVQVVWKPVETNTPVHYTIQCKSEGKVELCLSALQRTS